MRLVYTILAVLLIGATVFTFMIKEDPQPAPPTLQNSSSSAQGLNPAHGQPGHRCELPVGAPLNPEQATTKAEEDQKTNSPVVTAKPKTNPAHGLPGHRCDLAVGAAL